MAAYIVAALALLFPLIIPQEISELKDNIQDLMFHMEAQQKLKGAEGVSQEEIEESHVVIGASGTGGSRPSRKPRKKPR